MRVGDQIITGKAFLIATGAAPGIPEIPGLKDAGFLTSTHWVGVRYERVEGDRSGKRIFIEVNGQKRVVEAEELLVATGRRPNTAALELENAGVRVGQRGEVVVDDHLRTSNPRVFAAGDVTLGPQFVYVAAYEGAVAARVSSSWWRTGPPGGSWGRTWWLRTPAM